MASILNDCINNKVYTAKQFVIKQQEFKSSKKLNRQNKKEKEKFEYEEVNFTNEEEYKKKILGKG